MRERLLECLICHERAIVFDRADSYLRVYREFTRYFENISSITAHHVIIGASFTYSWMPTILNFGVGDIDTVADILNNAKRKVISRSEFRTVAEFVNNSLVGASKLLHFVNPSMYAIWDSRVCRYLFGQSWQYQIQDGNRFWACQSACTQIAAESTFEPTHRSVSEKIGYPVTAIRAAELIMFKCGTKNAVLDQVPG